VKVEYPHIYKELLETANKRDRDIVDELNIISRYIQAKFTLKTDKDEPQA